MTVTIEDVANWASVLTAAIASGASLWLWCRSRKQMKALENYLLTEKKKGQDNGQRSLLHLMARVGLTEDEIIQASFRSKRILRKLRAENSGLASDLLLEHDGKPN